MTDTSRKTKLSDDQVADVIGRVENTDATVAGEARRLGVARSTLRNAIEAFERRSTETPEPGVVEHEDGGKTVTSAPVIGGVRLTDSSLCKAMGVDPDEHVIVRRRINAWGSEDDPRFQLRLDLLPKELVFLPDPTTRPKFPTPNPAKRRKGEPLRWAFVTDYHAPYIDHGLHQTSCEFLRDHPVDLLIHGGDLLNNGKWARHRSRPRFMEESNEGIMISGGILDAHREILPDAEIIWIPGNHDQWIEQRLIEDRSAALGTRGYRDQYDVLDLRRLLDTDGAHVKYIDEDWDLAAYPITDKFTGMHGPGTGQSLANRVFNMLTGSAIYGHTHHGKFTYKTRHDPATQTTESHVAIEAFMMARHDKGMGYANQPDWTQGFVYGAAWDDGYFTAAPAFYNDAPSGGSLLLPDGSRYEATVDKFGEKL